MRIGLVRCKHCQTVYNYYMSGCDTNISEFNDSKYCPICYQHILESLKSIHVKYTKQLVETNEVTYEELKNHEALEKSKNTSLLPISIRIYAQLYNTERNELSITESFNYKGRKYIVNYWPSKPEDKSIRVEMNFNEIIGDFEGYWQDLN